MSRVKPERLLFRWCNQEKDWRVWYPRSVDGAFVLDDFTTRSKPIRYDGLSFVEELERRGYDPKTLRFTIDLKEENKS